MKKIYFVTSSSTKLKHFNDFFNQYGIIVEKIEVDLPEIQSLDIVDVCKKKIMLALKHTDKNNITIIDDTGLYIDDLKGFPGALIRPILDTGGLSLLNKITEGVQSEDKVDATFKTSIVAHVKGKYIYGNGSLPGVLNFQHPELKSLSYCSHVFYPEGENLSLHELHRTIGERAYKHRQDALANLHNSLKALI